MPIGEGFWISPEGKVYDIFEHLSAVQQKPKLFGLKPGDLSSHDRVKILSKVMRNEWIRVRYPGGSSTFEGAGFNDWFLARVRKFLGKINAFPQEQVIISDINNNKVIETTAGEVLGPLADTWTNPRRRSKISRSVDVRDLYVLRSGKRRK